MGRTRTITLAAAAALLVTLIAVMAAQVISLHGNHVDDARSNEADAAAVRAVTATLSYDYRHLAADQATARQGLIDDARVEYEKVMPALARTAPKLHAVVKAQVVAHSVMSLGGDTARVLLFVDQTSTSAKLTRPQLDQSRVVVTLVRRGGEWLVSSLQAE